MNKLKISKKQLNLVRVIYATMLGCKYYSLEPKHLFESKEVNPLWWRERDVLRNYTPKSFIDSVPDSKDWGWYKKGFLKFRKTKKGAIIYLDLVTLRNSSKKKK